MYICTLMQCNNLKTYTWAWWWPYRPKHVAQQKTTNKCVKVKGLSTRSNITHRDAALQTSCNALLRKCSQSRRPITGSIFCLFIYMHVLILSSVRGRDHSKEKAFLLLDHINKLAVRSWRLTAWAMALPSQVLSHWITWNWDWTHWRTI
jgi:hypothetical protein